VQRAVGWYAIAFLMLYKINKTKLYNKGFLYKNSWSLRAEEFIEE